jgi:hypothetical protein
MAGVPPLTHDRVELLPFDTLPVNDFNNCSLLSSPEK